VIRIVGVGRVGVVRLEEYEIVDDGLGGSISSLRRGRSVDRKIFFSPARERNVDGDDDFVGVQGMARSETGDNGVSGDRGDGGAGKMSAGSL
jgi:hypothetical protein